VRVPPVTDAHSIEASLLSIIETYAFTGPLRCHALGVHEELQCFLVAPSKRHVVATPACG
jgi:hypothetical protein